MTRSRSNGTKAGSEVSLKMNEDAPSHRPQDDAVDWDGPDDPKNPRNWTARKSFGHVIIVAVLSMVA
jgi:hypothetical protein